jgi:hypothetical protein
LKLACSHQRSTIPWLAIKNQIIREWLELDGIGVRVADLEPGFVCRACGKRGARLRPVQSNGRAR